jgi:hypothetical protein
MHEPQLIWRFGRWIARRESGAARLGCHSGEAVLRLRRGKVVSLEGLEAEAVARHVGSAPIGHSDLLEEARALATERGVGETEALGAVKEILQGFLTAWLVDPDRQLEIVDGEPDAGEGPSISLTHAIVELVLASDEQDLASMIIPDLEVLLRRSSNFLELYSPLRLSEEADLVVAKITGQRTAEEIANRSPHGSTEVVRLLAALVATGMLEPVPIASSPERSEILTVDFGEDEPTRKKLPVRWIAAAAAALVIVLAVVAVLVLRRDEQAQEPAPESGAEWTLVVDMGCEPQELQRVLHMARLHPEVLRPVQTETGSGEPCWRLVWGSFPNRETAESQLPNIPDRFLPEGFIAHPVQLMSDDAGDPTAVGQE